MAKSYNEAIDDFFTYWQDELSYSDFLSFLEEIEKRLDDFGCVDYEEETGETREVN